MGKCKEPCKRSMSHRYVPEITRCWKRISLETTYDHRNLLSANAGSSVSHMLLIIDRIAFLHTYSFWWFNRHNVTILILMAGWQIESESSLRNSFATKISTRCSMCITTRTLWTVVERLSAIVKRNICKGCCPSSWQCSLTHVVLFGLRASWKRPYNLVHSARFGFGHRNCHRYIVLQWQQCWWWGVSTIWRYLELGRLCPLCCRWWFVTIVTPLWKRKFNIKLEEAKCNFNVMCSAWKTRAIDCCWDICGRYKRSGLRRSVIQTVYKLSYTTIIALRYTTNQIIHALSKRQSEICEYNISADNFRTSPQSEHSLSRFLLGWRIWRLHCRFCTTWNSRAE